MKRLLVVLIGFLVLAGHAGVLSGAAAQDVPVASPVRDIELGDYRFVGLSPDGSIFAAVIQNDSLCTFDAETTEQISCAQLDVLNAGIRIDDILWSPDSTRLVFAEQGFVFAKDGDLWVMDAQSGALTNITDDGYDGDLINLQDGNEPAEFFIDVSPAWTPDSQFITFSRSGWVNGERTGNVIAQVPAGGGDVETLFQVSPDVPGIVYFRSAWAPDGATFYYSVSDPSADNPDNGIWAWDKASDTTRQLAVADLPELGPLALKEVSPANDRLLAFYPQALGNGVFGKSLLRFVDIETGAVRQVPDPDPESEIFGGTWISTFSPDGQYLLQAVGIDARVRDVWITNLATEESTVVASDLEQPGAVSYGLGPTWAADGTVMLAHGVNAAYSFTITGAGTSDIVPNASPVAGISPVPDGGMLVTTGLTPLFSAPDANATVVLLLGPGHQVQIVNDPVETDAGIWYPVIDPETQTIGYVQASRVEQVA